MAQIKEFSTADLNTISRINTVSNTLEKINGVTVVASVAGAFLLDTYTGATAAYSTRKLKTGVTVAARIRRSGDDIEADVEFDSNNEISLTSPISNASSGTYTDLADFVDHSTTPRDAFVDEWKDQSGSGNHAAQATAGSQPKLYDATTGLITENGKPAMDCANSALVASSVTLDSYYSWYYVAKPDASGGFIFEHSANSDPNDGGYNYLGTANTAEIYRNPLTASRNATAGAGYAGTSQTLIDWNYSGTWTAYKDGTALSLTTGQGDAGDIGDSSATDELNLFSRNESTLFYNGKFHEIIFWNNDQDAAGNRTGIESNINSEFLIYQPTDAPTSGLLATYTGAAAAYSVRQLSDKAVIAMRIRRDSDDEERNIGFDSNGDLDTTAISDFCDTANGYVVEWADQSTNGNHASQSTSGSQPQIYNGTAVITENGKPAPTYNVDTLDIGYENTSASNYSFFTVSKNSRTTGSFMITSETPLLVIDGRDQGSYFESAWRGSGSTTTSQILQSFLLVSSSGGAHYENGSAISTGLTYTQRTFSGARVLGDSYAGSKEVVGVIQEVIIYPSDQSSNRTGIETDINGYFSIY